METWEVVLILALVTVAVSVLVKNDISVSLIDTLDNTLFQLAILAATLLVATVSPAVAIVAIATIVVVYYVRNLAKIQMIEPTSDEPRIEVTEVKTMTMVGTPQINIVEATPVSKDTLPQVPHGATPPTDNSDVVATALGEHVSRPPQEQKLIGQRAKIGGTAPFESQPAPAHENFENPRGEGFIADALDKQADFYGDAPTHVDGSLGSVDSDVFTPAPAKVEGSNEALLAPEVRPYNDNQGQYTIGETRPYTKVQKYELASFQPGADLGSNEFEPVGVSIDDKVANLSSAYMPSANPPPNFNNAAPGRA